MTIRILYVGDIVGAPGRRLFTRLIPALRKKWKLHAVIANAENAAGGRGLTPSLAEELLASGADLLTLGDHAWDQKEIIPFITRENRILRPCNFAPECPGVGTGVVEVGPVRLGVAIVIGRVFLNPADCPFRSAEQAAKRMGTRLTIVEMHAEATSEKIALAHYLDGRVTAVVGTHTHVQTADERILPKGTAFITDLGMTGPRHSIIGREITPVLRRFLTGMPAKFEVPETGEVVLEGVLIAADSETGRALSIKRIREIEPTVPSAS